MRRRKPSRTGRAPGSARRAREELHGSRGLEFVGHYRARQCRLWLDGVVPMRPVDANTFRIADPEHCPEWVQFLDVVNGKSRHIKISGEDLYRVDVP